MNRRTFAAIVLTVGMAGPAAGQAVSARIDGGAVHAHVATLSAPEWQGRRTLTPGFDKAAEWAAARFREWGLKPAGDDGTFFQAVPILGPKSDFLWTTGMPALSVNGRDFSFKESDFVVDPSSSGATDVTGEAVFAGYGISAAAKGLDEYAGLDVAGKIVFVLRGSPKDAPVEVTDFPGDPPPQIGHQLAWDAEITDQAKAMTAYRKGAAAVVICDADPAAHRAPVWAKVKPSRSPFTRPFLVLGANDPHVLRSVMLRDPLESLVGYIDRINRLRRAVQQGRPQSEATGVRVRTKGFDEATLYGESFGKASSRNVLARIEGSDPTLKGQAVVVGAHLDHLGYRAGLIQPGADDNGSGSGVVLEVARVFAASGLRPKRTVVFALWCGEEYGHHGSKRFTASPADGLSIDRIVAYINMDMVGLGTGIEAAGARDFPAVFSVMMRDQLPDVERVVKPEVVGPGGSDYQPFIDAGVDAVSLDTIGGHGHPDYHDAADVASKIQPEMLALVGQFVLQAAANLANEVSTPLPVPGRRQACDALRFAPLDMSAQAADGWRTHPARTAGELQSAVVGAIGAAKKARAQAIEEAGDPTPATLLSGIGASAAEGNLPLLVAALTALDLGRIDLSGEDGAWVTGGLSMDGKALVAAADRSHVVIRLDRPSPSLLGDVLAVSAGPVLITGTGSSEESIARQMTAGSAVLVVGCTADGIESCASRLHALRTTLGNADSLLVSMGADQASAKTAHRALYQALAAKGWTKNEIYGVAGQAPDGSPGGSLSRVLAVGSRR